MLDDMIEFLNISEIHFLAPLHINMKNNEDHDKFVECASNYIKFLYERYKNEKKIIKPKGIEFDRKIHRQVSLIQAIRCPQFIYEMKNYRRYIPSIFKLENHGGSRLDDYMTISFINYYLLNYRLPQTAESPQVVYEPKYITLNAPYKLDMSVVFQEMDIEKILNLCDNIEELVNTSQGVIISSTFFINDIIHPVNSHAQSFLICGGKEYFYDDNGAELIKKQNGSGPETDERRKIEEKQKIEDHFKIHGYYAADEFDIGNTMCLFEWRKFIKETCMFIRSRLLDHKRKVINLSNEEIKNLMYKFSDFYSGYDKSRDITISVPGFEMPDDKKDKDIYYIRNFTFVRYKKYKGETDKDRENEYFLDMENIYEYNLFSKYRMYNIDENKIIDLIKNNDIIQLKWVLKYSVLNLEKLEKYKEIAYGDGAWFKYNDSYELINEIIEDFKKENRK
jgi:hypothetical protein